MRSWRNSTGPRETILMYNPISSSTGKITGNARTMIKGSKIRFQDGTTPSGDKKSAETKSTNFNSIKWALLPKPGELGQGFIAFTPLRQEVFGITCTPLNPKAFPRDFGRFFASQRNS